MTTLTSQESTSPGSVAVVTAPARDRNDNEATKVKQRAMLDDPVLPTLLKLALPTVIVLRYSAMLCEDVRCNTRSRAPRCPMIN